MIILTIILVWAPAPEWPSPGGRSLLGRPPKHISDHMLCIYIYIYVYTHMYVCMYIYIYICLYYIISCMCIYIYIYVWLCIICMYLYNVQHIYIYIHICAIYIYIYRERERYVYGRAGPRTATCIMCCAAWGTFGDHDGHSVTTLCKGQVWTESCAGFERSLVSEVVWLHWVGGFPHSEASLQMRNRSNASWSCLQLVPESEALMLLSSPSSHSGEGCVFIAVIQKRSLEGACWCTTCDYLD